MPPRSPAGVNRRLDVDEEVEEEVMVIEGSNSENRSVNGDGDGDEDDSSVSDCESVASARIVERVSVAADGLVRLGESDKLHEIIAKKFVSGLDCVRIDAQVVCIHRNLFDASAIAQARLSSFRIFAKSVGMKNGGDANIKYAWFGASKDRIGKIVEHGFGFDDIQKSHCFGHGIVLSTVHSPLESVELESATADEDGIKHILLCRVILGKSEIIHPGSTQSYPSSQEFQSGVDDVLSPKKYIIWSHHMNTHILPEFVISFKTQPTMNSMNRLSDEVRLQKPVSPWIPIPDLIAALSKILAPRAMKEIIQFRRSYIEHTISRRDMIRGIRGVTGDRLLLMVLKDFTKQRQANRRG